MGTTPGFESWGVGGGAMCGHLLGVFPGEISAVLLGLGGVNSEA